MTESVVFLALDEYAPVFLHLHHHIKVLIADDAEVPGLVVELDSVVAEYRVEDLPFALHSKPHVENLINKFEISFPLFVVELNIDMLLAFDNLADRLELDFACVNQLVNEVD